jgi:hypothetical protein
VSSTCSSEPKRVLRRELLAERDALDVSQDRRHRLDRASCDREVGADRQDIGRTSSPNPDLPAHARRLMEIVGLLPFIPVRSRRADTQLRGRQRVYGAATPGLEEREHHADVSAYTSRTGHSSRRHVCSIVGNRSAPREANDPLALA